MTIVHAIDDRMNETRVVVNGVEIVIGKIRWIGTLLSELTPWRGLPHASKQPTNSALLRRGQPLRGAAYSSVWNTPLLAGVSSTRCI